VKLSQVIDLLREAANCNFEVETEEGRLRTNDVRVQVGSHQQLTRDTGWEPQISVRETVGGVLEYWRQTIEEGL
jgi:GDP-4-dehydro-6-deoxy-D-mannose reductase